MGKIRVKTFGDEEQEQEEQKKARLAREAKKAAKQAVAKTTEAPTEEKESTEKPEKTVEKETTKKKPAVDNRPKTVDKRSPRSRKYKSVVSLVDRTKTYTVTEALELLPKLKISNFDETVELHVNTTEQGISGSVTLPHGTGKKTRVVIVSDAVIAEISQGKISFDILLATPDMMPKLAKVAKVLGPRGLMPNPKNGTVTQKPEEVAKKYEGGQITFKTESKSPIIHVSVGKLSFGDKKLEENIKEFIKTLPQTKIKNITLKSTMSPGIKLQV